MMRKIIPVLCLLALAGVLFSATEPVALKNSNTSVDAPPRTITVRAGLEGCLYSQTANVYVRINGGSWALINSVATIPCKPIGTFSASDGDLIEFMVRDAANTSWYAEYRAQAGSTCPTNTTPFCGDGGSLGTVYSATLTSTITQFTVLVSIDDIGLPPPSCYNLLIC